MQTNESENTIWLTDDAKDDPEHGIADVGIVQIGVKLLGDVD